MGYDRCGVIGGPCKIVVCDQTYVSVGDVSWGVKRDHRDLESSLYGKVGKQVTKSTVEIKFTPVSIPAYVLTLFPFQPSDIGKGLYGCSDCAMSIWGRDGLKRNFKAVAITKPPQVTIASRKDLFGEVTFGAVVANSADLATVGNVTTTSSATFVEPAEAADPTLWVARAASVSWGASPFDALETFDGVTIDVTYGTKDLETDRLGVVNTILSSIDVKAKFSPANLAASAFDTLLPLDGPAAVPGYNESSRVRALIVAHSPLIGGVRFTMPASVPVDANQKWGREVPRWADVEFNAISSVDGTSHLPNNLYLFENVTE